MKLSFLLAGAAALVASTFVVLYVVEKPSPEDAAVAPPAVETIPTPQYLLDHPDVFREAEQRCQDGTAPSSLYCSNVHKAESLRLADEYRRGMQPEAVHK